ATAHGSFGMAVVRPPIGKEPQMFEGMKACPFCGGALVVVSDNGRGLMFNVHCGECRASGPWQRCAVDAKDAWNARTPAPPSSPGADALRKLVPFLEAHHVDASAVVSAADAVEQMQRRVEAVREALEY